MNLKQDTDYNVVLKLVRRELANFAKKLNTTTNPNAVNNFSFISGNGSTGSLGGGGNGNQNNTQTEGIIYAEVYGAVSGLTGETLVNEQILEGWGAIVLQADITNSAVAVAFERLNDPMEFIG